MAQALFQHLSEPSFRYTLQQTPTACKQNWDSYQSFLSCSKALLPLHLYRSLSLCLPSGLTASGARPLIVHQILCCPDQVSFVICYVDLLALRDLNLQSAHWAGGFIGSTGSGDKANSPSGVRGKRCRQANVRPLPEHAESPRVYKLCSTGYPLESIKSRFPTMDRIPTLIPPLSESVKRVPAVHLRGSPHLCPQRFLVLGATVPLKTGEPPCLHIPFADNLYGEVLVF